MNFLKRATPWMITLLVLLGVYLASYVCWYKPKRVWSSWVSGTPMSSKDKLLDQFYMPLKLWEEEQEKQNARTELLRQCQGDWEGLVRSRSKELSAIRSYIRVRASIQGDQFTITSAESMPELVGVTWKIGCEYDAYRQYGISSNKGYPMKSSIFFTYECTSNGRERLYEAIWMELGTDPFAPGPDTTIELERPTTPVTTTTN